MLRTLISLLTILSVTPLSAQDNQLPWQQRDRKDMQPIEYDHISERDVMWSKNIWRVIDSRFKLNQPFAYPQRPLAQILHQAAMRNEIRVYDPAAENADQFKKPLTAEQVSRIGVKDDTSFQISLHDGETEEQVIIHNELQWNRITKFRLKEVWFFDTQTSTMMVRILGIAPVIEDYDANGNYRGDMTMYWVPFASLRNILAKEEVFNPGNDWQHYSWDDLFAMRKFESFIYKESNVHDRTIQEYASGTDALLESERIKQEVFEKEHDLWNY